GHGMDEGTLAHLFEPFFTTKGVGQGKGLTLAAVHGIIKQCGGDIAVASRPGEGTTFTITFPAAVPQASEAPARDATAWREGGATILLVEDESAVRALARYVLQAQGYTVLEACDGEEALEVYAQHAGAIDLLVSDVVMPRRTGPELAQQLTEQAPDLPVLFLSGCNKDDADLGQSLGGRQPRFLAKPFRPAELLHLVREILRAARPERGC
ncbi:MAG: response regulator, partial [Terriglobales bacterium]